MRFNAFKWEISNSLIMGQNHILRNLRNREFRGELRINKKSKPCLILKSIPKRLAFCLMDIVPLSALQFGHVFLGFSRCGRFIISYTQVPESVDFPYLSYRYKLHWWKFVPYRMVEKIAEVPLFGDHKIITNLFLSLCYWPDDDQHVVIYGYNDKFEVSNQTGHCYLTITSVPSLNSCSMCKEVFRKQEAEASAYVDWDPQTSHLCLHHGLTIHTSFDVVPPFPRFCPKISLKQKGLVVVNAGNFIHVLSATINSGISCPDDPDLNKSVVPVMFDASVSNPNSPSMTSSDVFSDLEAKLSQGTQLTLTDIAVEDVGTSKRAKLNEGVRQKHKASNVGSTSTSYFEFQSAHSLEDQCYSTDDCDSDISCFHYNKTIPFTPMDPPNDNIYSPSPMSNLSSLLDSDDSQLEDLTEIDRPDSSHMSPCAQYSQHPKYKFYGKGQNLKHPKHSPMTATGMSNYSHPHTPCLSDVRSLNNKRKLAEQAYEFTEETSENSSEEIEKLSTYRKKRLADKKYEFTDENSENTIPMFFRPKKNRGHDRKKGEEQLGTSERTGINEEINIIVGERAGSKLRGDPYLDWNNTWNSPGSEKEEDKVLKPINHYSDDNLLLSPRENREQTKEKEIRNHDKIDMEGGQCLRIIRDKFCHVREGSVKRKYDVVHSQLVNGVVTPDLSFAFTKSSWVIKLQRHYMELDDDLISINTDIEDCDMIGGSGYHYALPIDVHGTEYCQMNMISKGKAEKLTSPSVTVTQLSLDLEQFCHEMAEKLCSANGMKYWYCRDYDVEIVDLCPDSGNLICVAYILVQATVKTKGLSKSLRNPVNSRQRRQYQTGFKFVWNIDTGLYCVIDTEYLEDVEGKVENNGKSTNNVFWQPAKQLCRQLQKNWVAHPALFVNIRVLNNSSELAFKSMRIIVEPEHFIALLL